MHNKVLIALFLFHSCADGLLQTKVTFHSKISGILFIHQPLGFLGSVSPWGWNPMLAIHLATTWQGLAWAFLQRPCCSLNNISSENRAQELLNRSKHVRYDCSGQQGWK